MDDGTAFIGMVVGFLAALGVLIWAIATYWPFIVGGIVIGGLGRWYWPNIMLFFETHDVEVEVEHRVQQVDDAYEDTAEQMRRSA